METTIFCQSCSMPIDDIEMRGPEKDGSKSDEYCKYCYLNGNFTDPNMELDEMKAIVMTQLGKMRSPANVIEKAVTILPELKRWKKTVNC